MDLDGIFKAITTVGFPIVMCCIMGLYIKSSIDKQRDEISRITAAHKHEIEEINEHHTAEIKEITQAVNDNTVALTRLCDKIGMLIK